MQKDEAISEMVNDFIKKRYELPDVIPIKGRGNEEHRLEYRREGWYELIPEYDTYRMGYSSDKMFIDPSGGPFMIEGSRLLTPKDTYKIAKIQEFIGGKVWLRLKKDDISGDKEHRTVQ